MRESFLERPKRLVFLAVAGAALAGVGFLQMGRGAGILRQVTNWGSLAFIVPGMFCLYWASRNLHLGVVAARWPAATVQEARRITTHPLWKAALPVCFVGMLVLTLAERKPVRAYWAIFLMIQALWQVQMALQEPDDRGPRMPHLRLTTSAPLRSELWGERSGADRSTSLAENGRIRE